MLENEVYLSRRFVQLDDMVVDVVGTNSRMSIRHAFVDCVETVIPSVHHRVDEVDAQLSMSTSTPMLSTPTKRKLPCGVAAITPEKNQATLPGEHPLQHARRGRCPLFRQGSERLADLQEMARAVWECSAGLACQIASAGSVIRRKDGRRSS